MSKESIKTKIVTMSLEEKVAQLRGIWLKDVLENDEVSLEKCRQIIPHGIGHISQFGTSSTYDADKIARLIYTIQQYLLTETQAKIPALCHSELINGVAIKGATATPQMIGMACSFRPELVKQNAANAAVSLKKMGGYHALSPMMDVITDARWGRGEEGFGEDAYMVSVFADAFITGLQGAGVGATAKHYAGYGVENQEEHFFLNETLAPFEAAITQSGVQSVMPGYHKFRGVPSSCSKELLIGSLRDHLQFDGMIVSDYGAIPNLHNEFHYTDTEQESAIAALNATLDVDFPDGSNYRHLVEAVQSGKMQESAIDAALARVLAFKETWMPKVPTLETGIDLDPPAHRADALQSARESIVLLKNNGILPLACSAEQPKRILLTGPNADSYYSLAGDYTWIGLAEFFQGIPGDRTDPYYCTLRYGLAAVGGDAVTVEYERGFGWVEFEDGKAQDVAGDERAKMANRFPREAVPETNFAKVLEKAKQCDVIIAAVGENRYLCGEGTTREDCRLPGAQEAYVEQLLATGKPVVLCVFAGRPMAIKPLAERCAAVVYAWYPGEEGGTACAEILFGKTNPTAKLAVTMPDTPEDAAICLSEPAKAKQMLYPFGFGLSYTSYAYRDFTMKNMVQTNQEYFDLQFTVENTGDMDGAESTQVYFVLCATGQKKLMGFTKTDLIAGAHKQLTMRFYLDQFGQYQDNHFVIGAGEYDVLVGRSSTDIVYQAPLVLVGDAYMKPRKINFFASVQ